AVPPLPFSRKQSRAQKRADKRIDQVRAGERRHVTGSRYLLAGPRTTGPAQDRRDLADGPNRGGVGDQQCGARELGRPLLGGGGLVHYPVPPQKNRPGGIFEPP